MSEVKQNKCPYPADFEPVMVKLMEIMPYFTMTDVMEGYLAMMLHRENRIQKKVIYGLEYYGGKWNWVKARDYVYEFAGRRDLVRRDSDAVSETSLAGALASVRAAAREGAEGHG